MVLRLQSNGIFDQRILGPVSLSLRLAAAIISLMSLPRACLTGVHDLSLIQRWVKGRKQSRTLADLSFHRIHLLKVDGREQKALEPKIAVNWRRFHGKESSPLEAICELG